MVLQFKPTAADYRRALFWYQRSKIALLVGITLLIASVCAFTALVMQPSGAANDPRPAMIVTAIVVPFFFGGIVYWTIHAQAKRAAADAQETEFRFTDEGVEISNAIATSQAKWEAYKRVLESKDDFLLFPHDSLLIAIPKRVFADITQVTEFRSLLDTHLGDRARLLI